MEDDDDGLLLNFVTTSPGTAIGKRKSSKARYAERHGKAAKKKKVHNHLADQRGTLIVNTQTPQAQLVEQLKTISRHEPSSIVSKSDPQKSAFGIDAGGGSAGNAVAQQGDLSTIVPAWKMQAETASAQPRFPSKKPGRAVGQLADKVFPGNGPIKISGSGGAFNWKRRNRADEVAAERAKKGSAAVEHGETNAAAIKAADLKVQPSKSEPLSPEASRNVFSASSFVELGLSSPVAQHIEGGLGFTAPTHVQKEAIPAMLTGRDCLVKADTGSGKTLAYLAPIIDQLTKRDKKVERHDGTFALILAPTRELCLQIYGVAEKLVKRFIWLVPGQIMGGEKKAKEKARLRKGVTVLVATPGRLLDHLKSTASFRLDNLQWLIFDEADRLLDLGFEKDIVQILEILDDPSKKGATRGMRRQIALYSATLNARVDRLANLSLTSPLKVGLESSTPSNPAAEKSQAGTKGPSEDDFDLENDMDTVFGREEDEQFRIPSQLKQYYIKVPWKLRLVALSTFLRSRMAASAKRCKMVVFFSTCDAVEFHHLLLSTFSLQEPSRKDGGTEVEAAATYVSCPVFKLHGNLSQKERSQTFFAFGKAASGVLLCTDVAARGLDIPAVNAIVQYDTPGEAEEYVHRVGRTARLGQEGESFLFLQPNEIDYLDVLGKRHVAVQPLPLMSILDEIPLDRRKVRTKEMVIPEVHPGVLALENRLEAMLGRQRDLRQLATDAFRSFLRSYAAHKGSLKQIFHVKRLHLGHVARSFALRDAPSLLGQSSKKLEMKKEKQERLKRFTRKKKRVTAATMAE